MFVGCSEISISVIVKHVQHVEQGPFVCLGGLLSFSMTGVQKKLLGCGLLLGGGISTQDDTIHTDLPLVQIQGVFETMIILSLRYNCWFFRHMVKQVYHRLKVFNVLLWKYEIWCQILIITC